MQMLDEGNKEGARLALQELWAKDRYFGDPEDLAKKVKKIAVPPTYQQEQIQLQKQKDRRERKDRAQDRSDNHEEFREEAYGPQLHAQWLASCSWFFFLAGIGATVGVRSQSWLLALIALAVTGISGWFLGYRKMLDIVPLVITATVGSVSTLVLTLLLARLNYSYPIRIPYTVTISTGFFSSKDVIQYSSLFLGRQLNFGLISGAITAVVAILVGIALRPPWGKREDISYSTLYAFRSAPQTPASKHLMISQLIWIFFCTWIVGAGLAAIIAGVADPSWGFGWNADANMMVLGFLLGSVLGIGVGTSLPVLWTTFTH